jgi:peroxiredoxin Q/BCP
LIEPGKKAPAFTLADQEGERHALKDLAGRPVVLYFYPKDDTPGCTKEACAFQELLPGFGRSEAAVFGVSPDDEASHARFAAKYDLAFPLLADSRRDAEGRPAVCAEYGVWQEKSMYGRRFMGVVRTTYLIGRDGRVARRWDRVKVKGHAEAVLEALAELD